MLGCSLKFSLISLTVPGLVCFLKQTWRNVCLFMLLDFTLCSNKSQNMDKVMHFVCFLNDCCNYIRKQASCTV